jgi:excisionase family DNA binding protein
VSSRGPGLRADGDAVADRPATVSSDLHALPALLTVAETAELLRVGRSWVYEHAAELGAVKLGTGQTAPLRIPRDGVHQIVGIPSRRRQRRSVSARQAREAETAAGELRPRPRL